MQPDEEDTRLVMWDRMRRFYDVTKRPITIFVDCTADAAAAFNILSSLLKSSLIPFSAQPVATLDDIHFAVRRLQEGDDEKEFFVLVGVGATVPLRNVFDRQKHTTLIIDNHRPFHLSNLRDELTPVATDDDLDEPQPWLMLWQGAEVRAEVDMFFESIRKKEVREKRKRRERQRRTNETRKHRRRLEAKASKSKSKKKSKKVKASHMDVDIDEARDIDVDADEQSDDNGEDDDERASITSSSSRASLDGSEDEDDEDNDAIDDEESSVELNDFGSDVDEDDEGEYDDVPASQSTTTATNWRTAPDADLQSLPQDVLSAYYSATCCGQSVAMELLNVAVRQSRSRDAFWWYASVGITDLFLRCQTDVSAYYDSLNKVRGHILQINARHQQVSSSTEGGGDAGARMTLNLADEPQLFLLRHWSLWSSVWHSKWAAGLLRLHHVDSGEEHLRELLARSGISVRVAQQSWVEAGAEDRAQALELVCAELSRLESLNPKSASGLDDPLLADNASDSNHGYPSTTTRGGGGGSSRFLRRTHNPLPSIKHPNILPTVTRSSGFGLGVSAFDACHLFRGLMCSAVHLTNTTTSTTAAHNAANAAGPSAAPVAPQTIQDVQTSLRAHHRTAFWSATRALDLDPNDPYFTEALDAAKRLQSSVMHTTSALMQYGVIISARGVHYCSPSRQLGTLDAFWTPLRLQYLAEHVVVHLTIERGRQWAMWPLSLCSPWPVRDASGKEVLQVCLTHAGAVNGPNRSLPAVADWSAILEQALADDVSPDGTAAGTVTIEPLQPLTVRVRGRDAATLLMEQLYVRAADRTRRTERAF